MNSIQQQNTGVIDHPNYTLYITRQFGDDHKQLRHGRLTGSKISDALNRTIWNTPDAIADLILGYEPPPKPSRAQRAIDIGNRNEPIARSLYSEKMGVPVVEVGCVIPKWDQRLCGSPDGLVGDDGIIEIKCPEFMYPPIKMYLEAQKQGSVIEGTMHIRPDHYDQMQFYMRLLERKWCDYIVYSQADAMLFIQRIYFNEKHWNEVLAPGIDVFFNNVLPKRIAERCSMSVTPPAPLQFLPSGSTVS